MAGCMYQNLNFMDSVDRLNDFCQRLGCETYKMFGAYIPSGGDILLRYEENVYFIGDAAGLAEGFSGGGIHYALISSRRLSNALIEGKDYEVMMKNIAKNIYKDYMLCEKYYEERLKRIMI